MHLLRSLWFFTAHYDINLACEHIVRVANTTADHLSRHNHRHNLLFFSQNPDASLLPTPLPASLMQITSAVDQIGHQLTSVSCLFLPLTQSDSLHTQALQLWHPEISIILSRH